VGISWFPAAILHTGDGRHWNLVRQVPAAPAGQPAGAAITSVDELVRNASGAFWAVAHAVDRSTVRVYLLRSRDGGKHWSIALNLAGGSGFVSVTGSRLGAFVTSTSYRLYTTDDGGKTWSRRHLSMYVWNVQPMSSSALWGFGSGGVLLHTSDAGRTWQHITIRVRDFQPSGLSFLNPSDGWITGTRCDTTPCTPVILRTRDGGAHWLLIRFRPSFASDGFDWVTPRIGYVMLNGALYRTGDGGISWHTVMT
jgi:photosystem II stability/assembly factor-like uncharacterized protein